MQRARNKFLASAALAQDEHRAIRVGHALDHPENLLHGCGSPDDLVELVFLRDLLAKVMILGDDPQRIRMMWTIVSLLGAVTITASLLLYFRGESQKTEWNDAFATVIYGSLFIIGYILYMNYSLLKTDATADAAFQRCDYITRVHLVVQFCRVIWCWLLLLALPLVAWLYLSSWFK